MMLELKVKHVMNAGNGLVCLLMIRKALKTRIEPINQTDEQRLARQMGSQIQQVVAIMTPQFHMNEPWDARIDMQITEDEYRQMGNPTINDTIRIELETKKEA